MEYLSQRGVPYTERNVAEEPEAIQDLLALGSQATPTTLIDNEHVIIGFDRARLDPLLGLSGSSEDPDSTTTR